MQALGHDMLLPLLLRFSDFLAGKPVVPRSPHWPALRRKWLDEHPSCEACGGTDHVTPHHIVPVHVDRSKELDESNLISLCEHPTWNCHLQAHGGNWRTWRPDARKFAAKLLAVFSKAAAIKEPADWLATKEAA